MPVFSLLILVAESISAGATHLWLAPTLLLLPGAGTIDSDKLIGLIVITR